MTVKRASLILAFPAAAMAAAGAARGAPESKPVRPVYESSVGGVVAASPLPGAAGEGYLVYAKWCAGCHAPPYQPADPAIAETLSPVSRLPLGTNLLQQRYKGSVPAALEQRTDLTTASVAYFVRHGVNAMPAFRKTEISDPDLQALSAYLTRTRSAAK